LARGDDLLTDEKPFVTPDSSSLGQEIEQPLPEDRGAAVEVRLTF